MTSLLSRDRLLRDFEVPDDEEVIECLRNALYYSAAMSRPQIDDSSIFSVSEELVKDVIVEGDFHRDSPHVAFSDLVKAIQSVSADTKKKNAFDAYLEEIQESHAQQRKAMGEMFGHVEENMQDEDVLIEEKKDVTNKVFFETEAECRSYRAGIEMVNDSSIVVKGISCNSSKSMSFPWVLEYEDMDSLQEPTEATICWF